MNLRNLIAGLVLCAVTAVYVHLIDGIPHRSLPNTPGPSFMPWLIAAAMGILSIALAAQGLFALLSSSGPDRWRANIELDPRVIGLLSALFLYVIAIPYAGFLYASVPFFGATMVLYGARQPLTIVAASVAVPIVLQFLFRHAFSIILPAGVL